jgi:hypothetical protein
MDIRASEDMVIPTVERALLVVCSAEPNKRCPPLDVAFNLWPPVTLQYEWFVRAVGMNIGELVIDALGTVPLRRWYCNVAWI